MDVDLQARRDIETSALIAGGIAHEINTMLTALSGTLQLMRGALPQGSMVFEFAAAERVVERAAALTHTLLSIERGDQGESEAVSLQKAVEDVLAVIQSRLHRRQITVELEFQPIPEVMASRCGLLRLVLEMIGLAERSLDGKGGRLEISTAVSDSGEACLSVRDNGAGGGDAEPDLIRDGLQRRGGRLEVKREPGSCTRTLWLPVRRDDRVDDAQLGAGLRTLVVDDDKGIRKLLTVLLESRGFEVRTANGYEAAVEKLAAERFDVVLLDLVMPGIQGSQLLDELRRDHPELAVIVISGESVDPSAEELQRRGATAVMRKPLKLERLARMCRAAARKEPMP